MVQAERRLPDQHGGFTKLDLSVSILLVCRQLLATRHREGYGRGRHIQLKTADGPRYFSAPRHSVFFPGDFG